MSIEQTNKAQQVQAALTRQLYATSYHAQLTSIALAVVLAYIQRDHISSPVIAAWLGSIVIIAVCRALLTAVFMRTSANNADTGVWLTRFRWGVVISGVAWGLSAVLLLSADASEHRVFTTFILAGMTAGGLISYAPDIPSARAFSATILLPLIVGLVMNGGEIAMAMGVAVTLYLIYMIASSRKMYFQIRENIQLHIEAKESEKKVRASEERYRLLLNHSPVGIIHFDTDLIITYCNSRFAEILHNTVERLVGLDMKRLKDQSILPALRSPLVGELGKYEGQYLATFSDADGWVAMICAPSLDEHGSIVGGVAIVQDITERKQVEDRIQKSEQRYRSLFNNAEVAMFRSRLDGSETLDCNDKFLEIIRKTRAEVIGKPSAILWKDPQRRAEMVRQLNAEERVTDFEFEMLTPDGESRFCVTSLRLFKDDGQLEGSIRDITQQKQAENALRESESRLRIMLENEVVGIFTSKNRIIQWANPAYEKLLGYDKGELIGVSARIIYPDEEAFLSFAQHAYPVINEGKVFRTELVYQRKDGQRIDVDVSGGILHPGSGETLWACVDITQRKKIEAELSLIAHYDRLTGIPNRVLLADRMKQAIAQTSREKNMLAVCYLDLDGFKPINDTLGHDAGDSMLVEIAQRIQKTIRGGDTVARLGGDEFVVLLLGLEHGEECVATLERLLLAIAHPLYIKNKSNIISASIGVSIYPMDDQDPDTLLRHADQAMYIAKQSGKNRFHIYDPEMDKRARDQNEILKSVRIALQQDQFELYYQPKINLASKKLVGAEALIRWNHPERGLLSPIEFLRYVENTELDIAIGEWVTATALAQMDIWRKQGLDISVSINISGFHLESFEFARKLQRQIAAYPDIAPGRFQIEVLETVALKDIAIVREIMESCREFGVGFALDDFGTGYSSLSYLSGLPVEHLKIDQSFVRDMLEDEGDRAIVEGILALARAFKLNTVAEGVETQAQFIALLEMGCEYGQGYGIARPMPAAKLLGWAAG